MLTSRLHNYDIKYFDFRYTYQDINEMETKLARVEIEIESLRKQNSFWLEQFKDIIKEINESEKIKNVLSELFTAGQIKSVLSGRKRIKWSADDISAAISLRAKAYRYLRNKLNYPLPLFQP